MIRNNKDFFDQSLGEIKLLRYLNALDPHDSQHVLRMRDFFYFRHAAVGAEGAAEWLSWLLRMPTVRGLSLGPCHCVYAPACLTVSASASLPACVVCREHLFIVCELLRDNLYELYKYFKAHAAPLPTAAHAGGHGAGTQGPGGLARYFTVARVLSVARQVLTALAFVHSHCLVHCDLKVTSPSRTRARCHAVVR